MFRTNYLWMDCVHQSEESTKLSGKIMLERQGAIKPVKRLRSLRLHPARSVGTILKVRNFVNRPDLWPLRVISRKQNFPSQLPGELSSRFWGRKVRSKCRTHHLSDKMVAQRPAKGSCLLKRLIHHRWRNIVGIDEAWCYVSHVNGRRKMFHEFCGKEPGKLEEHLSTEAFTWRYVRRGNQHLWSQCHLFRLSRSKRQHQLLHQQSSQAPFQKGHPLSVWEGSEFCRAVPWERPSAHDRGHRPMTRKVRLQFYSCAGLAR